MDVNLTYCGDHFAASLTSLPLAYPNPSLNLAYHHSDAFILLLKIVYRIPGLHLDVNYKSQKSHI